MVLRCTLFKKSTCDFSYWIWPEAWTLGVIGRNLQLLPITEHASHYTALFKSRSSFTTEWTHHDFFGAVFIKMSYLSPHFDLETDNIKFNSNLYNICSFQCIRAMVDSQLLIWADFWFFKARMCTMITWKQRSKYTWAHSLW